MSRKVLPEINYGPAVWKYERNLVKPLVLGNNIGCEFLKKCLHEGRKDGIARQIYKRAVLNCLTLISAQMMSGDAEHNGSS
jgi:hypothetical protein